MNKKILPCFCNSKITIITYTCDRILKLLLYHIKCHRYNTKTIIFVFIKMSTFELNYFYFVHTDIISIFKTSIWRKLLLIFRVHVTLRNTLIYIVIPAEIVFILLLVVWSSALFNNSLQTSHKLLNICE